MLSSCILAFVAMLYPFEWQVSRARANSCDLSCACLWCHDVCLFAGTHITLGSVCVVYSLACLSVLRCPHCLTVHVFI